MGSDDTLGKVKDPVVAIVHWFKTRPPGTKAGLSGLGAVALLLILWRTIKDHDTLFVLAEMAHFIGIGVLGYKLQKKKSVAGLSLQSQLLTATFLAVRLFCSFMMEYDIHTVLDGLTLLATLGVVYCMTAADMKVTYQKEQDIIKFYYVLVPCAVLALVAKPSTSHYFIFRIFWAFCVYLEAVSVFPQLRMMQKAKPPPPATPIFFSFAFIVRWMGAARRAPQAPLVVERFTAHYVFALGLSRFLSCAHWILQILEGNKYLLQALGSGLWPVMVLASEVVQTFILADFCYYYVKSYAEGSGIVRLPAGIV
ncbi:hypothetical protein GPECTOR_81g185 [Gonium pectorale]|uniref:ER lumen protein-retaining receptor n=1 Tax=Gonium pectorale TaxID=33097 RepID=A0A150G1L2_GONPE|nr:hypothetical protein GPECTOR_81g185 [Gonium pectorale]|eukprot:KXZ43737.1 hypothetical protein GPECTOR_81g185 [Gonium pectorale]